VIKLLLQRLAAVTDEHCYARLLAAIAAVVFVVAACSAAAVSLVRQLHHLER
jgi:hypothetical protein